MLRYSAPDVPAGWPAEVAPLNQSREATRNDLRHVLGLPISYIVLKALNDAMAEVLLLAPEAVGQIEALVAEWKALETAKAAAQSALSWDGEAPLKRADVLEYDTALLASGGAAAAQVQGLVNRQASIVSQLRMAIHVNGPEAPTFTPLCRS